MKTQTEAVFQAVTEFYGDDFENGMDHTSDDKKKIVDILIKSHQNGEWPIKSENAAAKLRSYVVGLLNNHLKKDKRLNGNIEYKAKNPGSKTGMTDKTIKALKQVRKTFADESPEAIKLDAEITKRIEEAKAKKLAEAINLEDLPEEFRSLVG